jgi:hypothetical protein
MRSCNKNIIIIIIIIIIMFHILLLIHQGAGIAKSIFRRATGWTAEARSSTGARNISLLHSVQTGSDAHAPSYTMDTGKLYSRDKATGEWK